MKVKMGWEESHTEALKARTASLCLQSAVLARKRTQRIGTFVSDAREVQWARVASSGFVASVGVSLVIKRVQSRCRCWLTYSHRVTLLDVLSRGLDTLIPRLQ